MNYELLSSLYYKNPEIYNKEVNNRKESISSFLLPLKIKKHDSFILMNCELATLLEKIYQTERILERNISQLPAAAESYYFREALIEEIILTNKIEGVHSTRRDIVSILERIPSDKTKRFEGLVLKYSVLLDSDSYEVSLNTCQDIRNIYDELVYEEIEEKNKPDGQFFRTDSVSVISATQKEKHQGVLPPESNIVKAMEQALSILDYQGLPQLVKIAILHYYIGYIHPFYDGNGRLSRFISSYLLSKNLHKLVALRLSYTIKDQQNAYLKAFDVCNNEKNAGDITFFVSTFLNIIQSSLDDLISRLSSYVEKLRFYSGLMDQKDIDFYGSELGKNIIFVLVQGELFSPEKISMEDFGGALSKSWSTIHSEIKILIEKGFPIIKTKRGRKNIFSLDLDQLEDILKGNNRV